MTARPWTRVCSTGHIRVLFCPPGDPFGQQVSFFLLDAGWSTSTFCSRWEPGTTTSCHTWTATRFVPRVDAAWNAKATAASLVWDPSTPTTNGPVGVAVWPWWNDSDRGGVGGGHGQREARHDHHRARLHHASQHCVSHRPAGEPGRLVLQRANSGRAPARSCRREPRSPTGRRSPAGPSGRPWASRLVGAVVTPTDHRRAHLVFGSPVMTTPGSWTSPVGSTLHHRQPP